MAFVQIVLSNEQLPELVRYQQHFEDFTPLLKELGIQAERTWVNIFQRQGMPKWEPLAESTLARRRKAGRGAKILQDEGRLFNSLTSRYGEGSVYKLTPISLDIGTNLPYARTHQEGGERSGVSKRTGEAWSFKIPKRPFLPTEEQLDPVVLRVITRFLKEEQ